MTERDKGKSEEVRTGPGEREKGSEPVKTEPGERVRGKVVSQ